MADDRNQESRSPKLWKTTLIGASIGVGLQILGGLVRVLLHGSPFFPVWERIVVVVNAPVLWLMPLLHDVGLIEVHDAVAVIIVFFAYSACIGSIGGIFAATVLRARMHRKRR